MNREQLIANARVELERQAKERLRYWQQSCMEVDQATRRIEALHELPEEIVPYITSVNVWRDLGGNWSTSVHLTSAVLQAVPDIRPLLKEPSPSAVDGQPLCMAIWQGLTLYVKGLDLLPEGKVVERRTTPPCQRDHDPFKAYVFSDISEVIAPAENPV